jgi:hypothetical protein
MYDEALEAHTQALERCLRARGDPDGCQWDHYRLATLLWITGHVEEAVDECKEFRRIEGRWSYADVRAILMLRELDRGDDATEMLDAMLAEPATDPWLRQILGCLAGDITPDELVERAEPRNPEHRCEAYYYAGEVCRLNGELERATDFFTKCVATGVSFDLDDRDVPMNEFVLAEWRLDQP